MPYPKLQDQEISLRECISIAIKRKWIIIAFLFASIIIATVVDLRIPETYEASMVIEVSNGLDLVNDIESKIRQKLFKAGRDIDFEVSQYPDLMKISVKPGKEEVKSGIEALNALFAELSGYYKEKIEAKKDAIEQEISIISGSIAMEKGAIKSEERNLKVMMDEEKDLLSKLKKVKDRSEKLMSERDALLASRRNVNDVIAFLQVYSSAIQQNVVYYEHLNSQLVQLGTMRADTTSEIEDLKTEIDSLRRKMNALIRKKDNISDIVLFQEPKVSSSPVGPKTMQNVALAGVLGLMLGGLLAFFMEYLEKGKI